ncbi:MAG: Gfo/Idh/MocA family oxidoreductase [Anaerolineae bacterium]|nr:Gfo/Idh/MocA family oxidoreductase [Anaerolineae bacterium]
MDKVKFAIVGCGSVSGNRYFPHIRALGRGMLTAVCDTVEARARPRAEEFGVPFYTSLDEMLAKADFDLLVNLTNVPTHYALNLKGLQAGKHVYTQKPMTVTVEEATTLINEAARRGLTLVSEDAGRIFPYNLTIKKLLDEGVIGKVVWARSRCTHWGPAIIDNWPTDPAWFYSKNAGPLRDVGVERLQLLTALLGPAKRVTAMSGINQAEVVVRGGPNRGKRIKVEEDDLTLITMDFGNSIFATLDAAWVNVRATRVPDLEITGQKGVITSAGGGSKARELTLELYRDEPQLGIRGWTEVQQIPPLTPPPPIQVIGLAHALDCIVEHKKPTLSAEFARHATEIIEKAYVAARTGVTQTLETTF